MLENLSAGIADLKKDEVLETVAKRLERGDDTLNILDDARRGMTIVGDQFKEGTLFLSEMLLSAEIFKEAMVILKPYLNKIRPPESLGKVLLATPKGDIHDLGKNILATLLEGQGFDVYDLGVDVDMLLIIEKIKDVKPDFVGFSALITTAFASMKQVAEILEKEGLRDTFKLMVGGGVTNSTLKDYIGADFQTTDAMEGVKYCLKSIKEKNNA